MITLEDQKICVVGDTHGYWDLLNEFIANESPDIILQCGDFGYWPNISYFDLNLLDNGDTRIYWCDGNHESFVDIKKLTDNQVYPNVYYMKRGSVLMLPDNRRVLFIGGAYSIDRNGRTPGWDWFPDEEITQRDVYNLPDVQVDIIISHTCPREFPVDTRNDITGGKYRDSSRDALSVVLKKYRPSLWYFGHWHTTSTGFTENCRWFCMNQIPHYGCYRYLEG